MHTLAHHAGEEALAPLLLLGGGGISLLLAFGRARLAGYRSGRAAGRRRWLPGPDDRAGGD